MSTILILHNIRSVHNVGSIFRTADAFGVEHIYLTGYTPTPVDRYGRTRSDFKKTALGAEESVPWTNLPNLPRAIAQVKEGGFSVVALEQHKSATQINDWRPQNKKLCLVLGNEVRGLSPQSLSRCDEVIEIPMSGEKESLNVSVTAGIALYAVTNCG